MRRTDRCCICRKAKATDACPKSGLPPRCRRCHAAFRLSYPCKCMTYEEALALREPLQMGLKTGGH